MTISDKHVDSIEFPIAPPFIRRAIALAAVAFLLIPAVWFPLKLGSARFLHAFTDSSLGWLLYAVFLVPSAFFLRLAFPPRSAQAKLQIRRDGISFIPSRWVRHYFAEPVIEAPITPQSMEILLRQKGLPNGYAVIVRSVDKCEREVYQDASLTLQSAEEGQKISEGISAVTGLPVRLVHRQRLADGTVGETPWLPSGRSADLRIAVMLATGALPFLGGIAAGYLVTSPALLLGIGLALWFVWRLAASSFAQARSKGTFATTLYAIANFFLFEVEYGFAVIIVIFLLRSP